MDIYRPGLQKIVARMSDKLDQAEQSRDAQAVMLIARVLECAAHQLTLENGNDSEIKESAEKLLKAQAALMRYEEE